MASFYKIWNVTRQVKKLLPGSLKTLEEIRHLGATKLGLPGPGVKLVLEVDGTEVDDDDILGALMGETMMLLQADEEWSKDGVVDGLVKDQLPGPSTPKHGQYRPDTPVSRPDDDTSISRPDTPVSRPGTPASRPGTPGSDTQNTPWTPPASVLRVTMSSPLPRFSTRVSRLLEEGHPNEVWSLMVSETAVHYMDHFPGISSKAEYSAIGKKMVLEYPCVKQYGNDDWVEEQKEDDPPPSVEDGATPPPAKRRVILVEAPGIEAVKLSEAEYSTHLEQLRNEWEKPARSEVHIKTLLKETFPNNQEYIKGLPDGQVEAIIDKIPCYRQGKYVMSDFKRLVSEKHFETLRQNLPKLCSAVEKMSKSDFGENPKERLLLAVQYIEGETKFDRGKGQKSKSIVEVKEDVPDEDIQKSLKTNNLQPPKLVVFKSEGKIKGQYIVSDNTYIECCATSANASILELMAAYYVFDMEYPRMYSQLLGILQTYLLRLQPYTGVRSMRFKKFSTALEKELYEEEEQ